MARDYKKILAWQRGHELTLQIYKLSLAFPQEERFGLTNQIRRVSYSVPANIAEGSARSSKRDYLRFLEIAMGSLKETEYFLILSKDLKYIRETDFTQISNLTNESFGVLHGLQKAVSSEI